MKTFNGWQPITILLLASQNFPQKYLAYLQITLTSELIDWTAHWKIKLEIRSLRWESHSPTSNLSPYHIFFLSKPEELPSLLSSLATQTFPGILCLWEEKSTFSTSLRKQIENKLLIQSNQLISYQPKSSSFPDNLNPLIRLLAQQLKKTLRQNLNSHFQNLNDQRRKSSFFSYLSSQEAFCQKQLTYHTDRTLYLQPLIQYLFDENNLFPLLLWGKPGSGKTTLLCSLYQYLQRSTTSLYILPYFQEAGHSIHDFLLQLSAIALETHQTTTLSLEEILPPLQKKFSKIALILDAPPEELPIHPFQNQLFFRHRIKFIYSSSSPPPNKNLPNTLHLPPLSQKETFQICLTLATFYKIPPSQLQSLLHWTLRHHPPPSYLKTIFHNLYLGKTLAQVPITEDKYIQKELDNLEQKFSPPFVQSFFCLLYASRYGLKIHELKEILNDTKRQTNQLLQTQFAYHFLQNTPLVRIKHRPLRQAISLRYSPHLNPTWNHRLFSYFYSQPPYLSSANSNLPNQRKLEEQPYQLIRLLSPSTPTLYCQNTFYHPIFFEACLDANLQHDYLQLYSQFLSHPSLPPTIVHPLEEFRQFLTSHLQNLLPHHPEGLLLQYLHNQLPTSHPLFHKAKKFLKNPPYPSTPNSILLLTTKEQKKQISPPSSPPLLQFPQTSLFSVASTPCGRWVICAGDNKTITLFDQTLGKKILTLNGHKKTIRALKIDANGKLAISGSEDKTMRLWDLQCGVCLQVFSRHLNQVHAVELSPDGKWAASGCHDGIVRFWDLERRQLSQKIKIQNQPIHRLRLNWQKQLLFFTTRHKFLYVYDLKTQKLLTTLESDTYGKSALEISPDATLAITGGQDKIIRIWDWKNNTIRLKLQGHLDEIQDIVLSPNDSQLISAASDGVIKIWDIYKKKCTKTLEGHRGPVLSLAFASENNILYSTGSDGSLRIWHNETKTRKFFLSRHKGNISAISTRLHLSISGSEDGYILLWNSHTGTCQGKLNPYQSAIRYVYLNREEKSIFGLTQNKKLFIYDLGQKKIFNIQPSFQAHLLRISPQETILAAANKQGEILLWDIQKYKILHKFSAHPEEISALAFDEKNTTLFSADINGVLKIWNLSNLTCTAQRQTLHREISIIQYAPQHQLLLLTGENHKISVWKLPNLLPYHLWEMHKNTVKKILLNEKQKIAITASWDHNVRLLHLESGQCLHTLNHHQHHVNDIQLYQNRYIASAGEDGKLFIWDTHLKKYVGHYTGNSPLTTLSQLTPSNTFFLGNRKGEILLLNWQKFLKT